MGTYKCGLLLELRRLIKTLPDRDEWEKKEGTAMPRTQMLRRKNTIIIYDDVKREVIGVVDADGVSMAKGTLRR